MASTELPRGKDSAIYSQGAIWSRLIDRVRTDESSGGGAARPDSFVYIVGDRGGGKSTILETFLHPDRDAAAGIKPTETLDFTFVRKQQKHAIERKDVANVWEISGAADFIARVAESEHLFLTPKQVATATVVIVLDLSRPHAALRSLHAWLGRIRARLGHVFAKFARRKSKVPDQLKQRARRAYGGQHEDLAASPSPVDVTGISVVIVANKFDAFRDEDPELKRVMARTLRYFAHVNGATLVYAQHAGDAKNCRITQANVSLVLNHFLFSGADRRLPQKGAVQTDHLGPVFLPVGADHLRDVGAPRRGGAGAAAGGGRAESDLGAAWEAVFSQVFPTPADGVGAGEGGGVDRAEGAAGPEGEGEYAEADIDALCARKLEELESYRKHVAAEQTQQQPRRRSHHAGGRDQGGRRRQSNAVATAMAGAMRQANRRSSVF